MAEMVEFFKLSYYSYRGGKKLHQICSATCIYRTVFELKNILASIRLTFKAYCLGKNESKSFFFVRKLSWFFLCISIHAIKVNCSDHSGQKETEVASETEPGHIFETIESFFVKRCVCVCVITGVEGHFKPGLFNPKLHPQTFQPQTFQPWTFQPQSKKELFNPGLFNHELFNPRFLNPRLFNPKYGVKKSGV